MKNIVIAGSGLGGLVTGGLLAKNGYKVTMYAKNDKDSHGYDWGDTMTTSLIHDITGKEINKNDFFFVGNTTFHNPSETGFIKLERNESSNDEKIERKLLSKYLIDFAEESGVKIKWNTRVNGAITKNGRVIGIETSVGNKKADIIIDACGINSSVRSSLPSECRIEQDIAEGEKFYSYRGLYKRKVLGELPDYPYEIHLLHQKEQGISWYYVEKEYIDILIGRFKPFGQEKIDSVLSDFGKTHPELTTELVRGGQFAQIPVRRPLAKMVCDGYAAIGDSAYMTIPMIGSGMDLSIRAAMILADTIMKDTTGDYTVGTLWSYNYRYIRELGKDLLTVDRLKNTLLSMNYKDIDFLIEKNVISGNDLNFSGAMPIGSLLDKVVKGLPKLPVLLKIADAISKGQKDTAIYDSIPRVYSDYAYDMWKDKIDDALAPLTLY